MRKILTLVTMLTLGLASMAQTAATGRISGSVVDGSQKIVESATISLLRAKDSASVKFSVADHNGKFGFEDIKEGTYLVSVTAVGHQKAYTPVFTISATNASVQLKTIELVPQPKALAGVTITGRKPFI